MLRNYTYQYTYAGHEVLDPQLQQDAQRLNQLTLSGNVSEQIDLYARMWREWHKLNHPSVALTSTDLDQAFTEAHKHVSPEHSGSYVYYPWSRRLMHILGHEAFVDVRTNRNKNKILPQEQALLATKTIAIVGLSVGNAIAQTIAMERICGTLILADFDELDLSNLNRINAKLHHIGVNKAVLAARQIAEMDPFLNVQVVPEGVTEQNFLAVLEPAGQSLDLLIEECDHLPTKLNLRVEARKLAIPVLMESSDRGMLDVERFDLEQDRGLLHGAVPEPLPDFSAMTAQERMKLVGAIINFPATSTRLKESFAEIGKTLSTWPQLASAVTLGGAVATDTARRLLLGQDILSGRYYIDLEQLVAVQEPILVN